MKALLVEFNLITGKRAGNIDPNDSALQCYGWQNLDKRPALEIRLIEDDRDIKPYEGIKGVIVLKTDEEIDAEIDKLLEEKYVVKNKEIFDHDLKRSDLDYNATFKELKAKKIRGIAKREVTHTKDLT